MRQAGKSESVLHPPPLYQGWTAFSLQTCLHLTLDLPQTPSTVVRSQVGHVRMYKAATTPE